MFVSPSKIKQDKLLRGRTINFETATKTHGNMVFIPTNDREAILSTLNSTLFRPMQLLAVYTPRRIQVIGRSPLLISQKDYYSDLRLKTNGKLRKGKTLLQSYNGQNVFFDIYNEYNTTVDVFSKKRQKLQLQNLLSTSLEGILENATSNSDYTDAYLVFPLERPLENPVKVFTGESMTDYDTTEPLALFVRAMNQKRNNSVAFKKVKMVFFYVPKDDILLAIDIHRDDFEKVWTNIKVKLKRMNAFLMGQDSLSGEIESEEEGLSQLSTEDKIENKKELIKKEVLTKVAKTIHANNLTDFEAATQDERDLMVSIDKKVDEFLKKPENLKKDMDALVNEVENDIDVRSKAVKYVETKKAGNVRSAELAKGMEKEAEIIGSLQDIDDPKKNNEPEIIPVNVPHVDKRIESSRLASFDEEYNRKQAMTDLTNSVSSFSNNEFAPLSVDGLSIEDTDTDTDDKRTMTVRYRTDDNKKLSFQIDIPKIVDKRYFYLGGNKKVIKKQLIRLPIVKTKNDRVEITTNYNKITVERTSGKLSRKNSYLLKKLKEFKDNPGVEIEYGDNSIPNATMGYSNDFGYEEIASNLNKIKTEKYLLLFNRDAIGEEIDMLDIPENFVLPSMTPIGFEKSRDNFKKLLFIENEKIYEYDIETKKTQLLSESLFNFLSEDVLHLDMSVLPTIGKSFIYTNMKFLATTYPILPVIASQKGLTNILNRYKVKYHLSDKREKTDINYVEVKFKDKYLYYADEMRNTLLLNSLYLMHPEEFNYSDFDADIPYTKYFIDTYGSSVGIHIRNTLKINFSVVVDPITRDILLDLKQPTDIIDILLYANTLLVGNQYKPQNDMTNYRIRSNEIVSDVLYGIVADAYVNYARHKMNGKPMNLVVPKNALISRLMAEPNINDKSTLNPVIEAEQIAQTSAKGWKGVNLNSAYTLEMRAYDDSMSGYFSTNSTPYSGQAGITRALTYDPNINTVRGYIPSVDTSNMSATNLLSPTELLSSFTATGADSPRSAMQVAQTGHTMPILHPSKQLIGTGMNKTLAFLISDDFCFKAKKSGIVEKIDKVNKVVILLYDDGTRDAVDIDDKFDKNSGMGFYIHQLFKLVYNEGEHFDAGDVIAYNPSYFKGKGKDIDYEPGALAKVAVAPGDFSFEDSTLISEKLAKKCAAKVNMLKSAVLGKNASIHSIVSEGDRVETGDHLIEFTSSFEDPDTADFLGALTNKLSADQLKEITYETIDAKYTGEITRIEIFYNCPFEELSPSLQDLIKKYKNKLSNRAKAVEGIPHEAVHIPPLKQTTAKKIGKSEFPDGGGVIINIYIEYIDEMGKGDKLTYMTALKGIISKVLKEDESPLCDYRPEDVIEGILTPTGILSRMTIDVYKSLFGNKCLVECGKQIREIWREE